MKLLTHDEVKSGKQRNQQEAQDIERYLAKQIRELNDWKAKKQTHIEQVKRDYQDEMLLLEQERDDLIREIESLTKQKNALLHWPKEPMR